MKRIIIGIAALALGLYCMFYGIGEDVTEGLQTLGTILIAVGALLGAIGLVLLLLFILSHFNIEALGEVDYKDGLEALGYGFMSLVIGLLTTFATFSPFITGSIFIIIAIICFIIAFKNRNKKNKKPKNKKPRAGAGAQLPGVSLSKLQKQWVTHGNYIRGLIKDYSRKPDGAILNRLINAFLDAQPYMLDLSKEYGKYFDQWKFGAGQMLDFNEIIMDKAKVWTGGINKLAVDGFREIFAILDNIDAWLSAATRF